MRRRSLGPSLRCLSVVVAALIAMTGCGTGSLATSESTPPATSIPSVAISAPTGPTLVVTVPDLAAPGGLESAVEPEPSQAGTPVVESSNAEPAAAETAAAEPATEAPVENVDGPAAEPEVPAETPAPAQEPPVALAAEPDPAAPAGEGLNVSLANCEGCTVLATHREVTGDQSAALVGTSAGRAILLSVGGDGQVNGVVGVPYGAAFAAPDGGVLACAQSRCVVVGRQSDGRAILSAFELTSSGAWRDISGDDAFPSATERGAVVDLGGELGIAVQDQGNGPAVWMLYTWGGDRFAVLGCTADGAAPSSIDAVSPEQCLS